MTIPPPVSAIYATLSDIRLEYGSFSVDIEGNKLHAHLSVYPGAENIIVMLQGAISRSKHTLPVFARWDWGQAMQSHVLAIADPTYHLSDTVSIGWYLGSNVYDPRPDIASLVGEISRSLSARAVFFGSSAGGVGAVAMAAFTNGVGVAINPQSDLVAYGKGVRSVAKLFGEFDPKIAQEKFSTRWKLAEIIRDGKPKRLIIAQNKTDAEHFSSHFQPLCQSLNLDLDGDNGTIATVTYEQTGGHNAPLSKEMANQLMSRI